MTAISPIGISASPKFTLSVTLSIMVLVKVLLTSVNFLRRLLLLLAGVVLSRLLGVKTSGRAVIVKVAPGVHGLLEGVTLPAEHVVTMGSGATTGHC